MDEYIGLTVEITLNNNIKLEGIVSSIELSTHSLTLSKVKSRLDDATPIKYIDKIVVKGTDIAKLDIISGKSDLSSIKEPNKVIESSSSYTSSYITHLSSMGTVEPVIDKPPGFSTPIYKRKIVSAAELERDLNGAHISSNGSIDPAILSMTSTKQESSSVGGLHPLIGGIDDDFKKLDLDSLGLSNSLSFRRDSNWVTKDVNEYKTDFDFEKNLKQFDKKKVFEEFKAEQMHKKLHKDLDQMNSTVDKEGLQKKTSKEKTSSSFSNLKEPLLMETTTTSAATLALEEPSQAIHFEKLYTVHGQEVPMISISQLNKVTTYATNRWGPNTVQMIENGARSLIELLQVKNISTLQHRNVLLLCGMHKLGGIALALGRQLINRGFTILALLLQPEISNEGNIEEEDLDRETKIIQFQKDIALKHSMVIYKNTNELFNDKVMKEGQFDFIVNAMTSLHTLEAKSESGISVGLPLKNWLLTKIHTTQIISFECISFIKADNTSEAIFPLTSQVVVSFGLPLSNTLTSIKKTIRKEKAITQADGLPRIFNLDIGICPALWSKFKIGDIDDGNQLKLTKLFEDSGFTELFYVKSYTG